MIEDITLVEYADWEGNLSPEDVHYISNEISGRLALRRQLHGSGYVLNPNQFAGVVVLPSGRRIESRPKVPIANLFRMMAVALELPFRDEQAEFSRMDEVLEFIAIRFADLVQARIDSGLYRSYVEQEENLPTIRGRIDIAEDIRRNYISRHRTYCRYTDLTWDVPENQIIRQVVHMLTGWGFREQARLQLAHLDAALSEVTRSQLPAGALDRFTYHRMNDDYEVLHRFCRLFLEGASLHEDIGVFQFRTFLIDMNVLFERYVTRILEEHCRPPVAIQAQARVYMDHDRKVLMRPDLLLLLEDTPTLIADCKYKRLKEDQVQNADLYQVLAYCSTTGVQKGMLVYPQHSAGAAEIHVRNSGCVIRQETIDLSGRGRDWERSTAEFLSRVIGWARAVG